MINVTLMAMKIKTMLKNRRDLGPIVFIEAKSPFLGTYGN
jgi:hypothetical protein